MRRISNMYAGHYAARREPFRCNGALYAHWEQPNDHERLFVVYSYGSHWPLYIWHEPTGTWYENGDRYSRTTSRHRNQAWPGRTDEILPCCQMRKIAEGGRIGAIRHLLAEGPAAQAGA